MAGFTRSDYVTLGDIHQRILERFAYVSDKDKHGLVEKWEDSSTLKNIGRTGVTRFTGDCEEFALVCLDQAMQHGFNARLVVCYVETGEGHAICEVVSSDYTEAFYLDNRMGRPCVRRDLSKYRFISTSPWNPVPADKRPWLNVK